MNFDANKFQFAADKRQTIEKKLKIDGYVQIQFSSNALHTGDDRIERIESFFIDIITKLGGQCLTHNEDQNSFVWHVRPFLSVSDTPQQLVRSQTDQEFPFQTDCSYESSPPEYVALFVLEQDQLGGGQLEIIRAADIIQLLSIESRNLLMTENFKINVPLEFRKPNHDDHINAPILFNNGEIRYRSDILSDNKSKALNELNLAINKVPKYTPQLEKYTMIILNNRKFLHGCTKILDFRHHLLRIRFNIPPLYDLFSVYNHNDLRSEYFTFSHTLLDYFNDQHDRLHKVMKQIVYQYSQPTELGAEIRRTFQFDPRIHNFLCELNINRPDFEIGSYRPDILLTKGDRFTMNGKYKCEPKFNEINARFPFNCFLLSASVCSGDDENQISVNFSNMLETIVSLSKFDTTKSMTILKSKEHGADINLFQQYWMNKYRQQCCMVDPNQLHIVNGQLMNKTNDHLIEQFIFELQQDEILQLSDNIFHVLIHNTQLRYLNDLRTIFILHDKRLFSLLSNQSFLSALMDGDHSEANKLIQIIPTTYIIGQMPKYVKESIIMTQQNWCIKPNMLGRGENISTGMNTSVDKWLFLLSDSTHQEWIVQYFHESIQFESMNLCGMLHCFNDQCFNMGLIRASPNKIVNITTGGCCFRPYVQRQHVYCTDDGSVLTKAQLREQLTLSSSMKRQWNKSVYLSSSGGSEGEHLFFATDIHENERQRQVLTDMMISEDVLLESDVCLNLFQAGNMYRSLEIFNEFCSIANCTTLSADGDAKDNDVIKLTEHFHPNVLMGVPSRLMRLALFIEKEYPKRQVKFDKILFSGESLDELKRDYFKRIFNCHIYLGLYGLAEAGVFACQIPKYSATRIYMYPKQLVNIEIVNSHIVVTNLIRRRNQLIRFDTGDIGQLILNDNNNKYGLVEVIQSERLIMMDFGTLSKSNIENCMKGCDIFEWQLIIDQDQNDGRKVKITFRYVENKSTSSEFLKKTVETSLKQYLPSTNIDDQLLIEWESVKYNELFRDKRSNKLLKIIDKRNIMFANLVK